MKYFRKNGKKNEIKPFQLQALYNSMMEMVAKVGSIETKTVKIQETTSEVKKVFTKIRRSYDNYVQLKLDCQTDEQWQDLKSEIEEAEHIPLKLKNILLNKTN